MTLDFSGVSYQPGHLVSVLNKRSETSDQPVLYPRPEDKCRMLAWIWLGECLWFTVADSQQSEIPCRLK